MLGPALAAAVITATLVLAFWGDVIAQRGIPDLRGRHARRFDRTFSRNLAARTGRHERR
jgi:hypothetical protein